MDIEETTFGPKQYLAVRRRIATSQITDRTMYHDAGQKLRSYAKEHGIPLVASWSVLYFSWDGVGGKAEIAIGMPVTDVLAITDPELSLINIPLTKAVMTALHGPYSGLADAHQELMRYVSLHALDTSMVPVMAIEEYLIDPMSESDAENFITNIYYLYI